MGCERIACSRNCSALDRSVFNDRRFFSAVATNSLLLETGICTFFDRPWSMCAFANTNAWWFVPYVRAINGLFSAHPAGNTRVEGEYPLSVSNCSLRTFSDGLGFGTYLPRTCNGILHLPVCPFIRLGTVNK